MDKERRLAAVRHCYANKWGDKGKALAALVDIWKETKDAAVLLSRIPCHRLKCQRKDLLGACDSCWAMGRIADLLAEHYEDQQITGELLRQRVHAEVGQGSMLAWLVLRALRLPVCLAMTTHRQDPLKPGVINFRTMAAFDFAENNDEAIGIGIRLGSDAWPNSLGWDVPLVAVRWLDEKESAAAVAVYAEADALGIKINHIPATEIVK